jgi:hypothetical protein
LQLKRDIYDLRQYGDKPVDMKPLDSDPLAPIANSCVFWADHLRDLDGGSPQYDS